MTDQGSSAVDRLGDQGEVTVAVLDDDNIQVTLRRTGQITYTATADSAETAAERLLRALSGQAS
jgi:hypothetical protein